MRHTSGILNSKFCSFGDGQLETTNEFAGLGVTKATAVPDSLLVPAELLEPATDPIGLRLLRLMGWRDGQVRRGGNLCGGGVGDGNGKHDLSPSC